MYKLSDLATIITALAALVASLATLVSAFVNAGRIKEVHTEVKTANSLSIAQLADAAESRRIEHVPVENRTKADELHLRDVSPPTGEKVE